MVEHRIAPLIEAAEAFPAFEAATLAAKRRILFGMRLFESNLPLLTPEARAEGRETWADLLAAKAAEGVDVRILLTDFEPIVAPSLHEGAWKSLEGFVKAADAVGAGDRLSVIACTHPGRLGKAMRLLFWPALRERLKPVEREPTLEHRPGLWGYLHGGGAGRRPKLLPNLRLWPATYHQKMASFDGKRAIVGGIDLAARMYDTRRHDAPAKDTWHDVSLDIAGPLASAAERHLHAEWNANAPVFNARVTRMGAPFKDLLRPVAPIDDKPAPSVDTGRARFLRTRSRYDSSPFALGPKPDVCEIEAATLAAIRDARRLIYLETQFLRSPQIAAALVEAGRRQSGAELIVLLPAAPDDVAFGGSRDVDARHGEWLQERALTRIATAWGDRCGVFALAQPRYPETKPKYARAMLGGAPIVYVHAKVSIFDSATAIVGSANLNGRSMKWDIEAAIEWRDAAGAADLQRRLWRTHFADAPPQPDEALGAWRRRASANAERPPSEREGFIMPYDRKAAAQTAGRSLWIPTNVV